MKLLYVTNGITDAGRLERVISIKVCLFFDKDYWLDSRASAILAWFFTLASEIPEIKDQCIAAREKALDYLMSVTRRSGAVDYSQGDTKRIGVYSQNFDILPFTQGFLLRTLNVEVE